MSYTLKIANQDTIDKLRRGAASFSFVNNETGEILRGVQECNINLHVDRHSPVVTIKFVPQNTNMDIALEGLNISTVSYDPETKEITQEFKVEG